LENHEKENRRQHGVSVFHDLGGEGEAQPAECNADSGRERCSSLLAQQYHGINRQRTSRWNPRSQQPQQRHG
jgi:hypothetical protein